MDGSWFLEDDRGQHNKHALFHKAVSKPLEPLRYLLKL